MNKSFAETMKEKNFIIHNVLYSEKRYRFTIPKLTDTLKDNGLELPRAQVKKEVDRFIELGLVRQDFGSYVVRDI